jgi:3-(3-hydroxy-phenyl)propionate hydroxylase
LAGVGLFDYGFEEPWLVVDTLMKFEEGLTPHSKQYCNPQRPVTVVPMSPGRYRFEFMLLPGEKPEEVSSEASIERLLKPFVKPGQAELVRKAVYQFHGLVAKQWRVRSLLLAGDSAHQMPPFMGQGMCSGIRDAVNLAWKLKLVLQGRATPALLDSYQLEREPHVRTIIEKAIEMGRVICTVDPVAAARRDEEMLNNSKSQTQKGRPIPNLHGGLLTKTRGAGELCPQPDVRLKNGVSGKLDDVLANDAWLFSKAAVNVQGVAALNAYQLGVDFDDGGVLERWLAEREASALLVRPDRYVFGSGEPHALIEQWQQGLQSAQ